MQEINQDTLTQSIRKDLCELRSKLLSVGSQRLNKELISEIEKEIDSIDAEVILSNPSKLIPFDEVLRRLESESNKNISFLIYPAGVHANVWIAHCLDMDLMSQGCSLKEAIEALEEAIEMVVDELDSRGTSISDSYPGAPKENWDQFKDVMDNGIQVALKDLDQLKDVKILGGCLCKGIYNLRYKGSDVNS